ncbi:HAMP domain-containing protein [Saccharothrix violaceirubra]|uniref:HAMP domain-containing protein n=1 Tax=Saccharothrix violaceirubra TaxID=413306 RepID=A0A7W7T4S2_9PSEU|nr:cache and HAMP domain-containing protein [Saccharothrix violaceirubra]MBB4966563.1 HAMP domain-containing protein [Saccharothrix violaceirubra]
MRRLPVAMLVALLVVAAATALFLGGRNDPQVPTAFLDAQRDTAESAARSVGATASQALADLRTAAANPPGDPAALLDKAARARTWLGLTLFTDSGRTAAATRGKAVPATALPSVTTGGSVVALVAEDGEPQLLAVTPLDGGRVLAATTAIRLPQPVADDTLGQRFVLTTLSGRIAGSAGQQAQLDAAVAALATRAGRNAAGGPGVLLGTPDGDRTPTLAFARVTPSAAPAGLDLAVVVVATGTPYDGDEGSGLVPAALLALLAIVGFLVVRGVVTGPIRAARRDLLRVAAGDLATEPGRYRTDDVHRVVAAARECRDLIAGRPDAKPPRGRKVSARAVTIALAATLFAWSAGMLVQFRSDEVRIPDSVTAAVRSQTGMATETLRRSLNDSLSDLRDVVTTKDTAALNRALRDLNAAQPRYRSVYLVDKAGKAIATDGRDPLRDTETPATEPRLRQQNQDGRVPVIFAEVPLPDGAGSAIAELDLDHLQALLGRVPGHARLVDGDLRTIGSTDGYVAFAQVTEAHLREGVAKAKAGELVGATHSTPGGQVIVASAAVSGGEAGDLGWAVVTERPGAELALPLNETRKHAQLAALLVALIALFGHGWLLFTVLLPLHRLARSADAVVDGDVTSVIYPQRHDEVGTMASCLEICRQAVVHGPGRLGAVRRPRGAATDQTVLMGRIEEPVRRGSS